MTLLKAEPVLRRLSLIQLIAYFGAWFSNVAVYTLLLQMDVNPGVVALTAALHFLPGVIQAPFSGPLIDRYAPKQLMMVLMGVEILATLPLMFVDEPSELWLLFVLVFIRMGAASFYFTLEMSLLPRILERTKLKLANEIHSIIWSLSYTLGMAISGFVVYLVGVKIAFLLDALLFVTGLLLLVPLLLPQRKAVKRENIISMMRESLLYLRQEPLLKHLILLHAFVGFTAFDALVALIVDTYYVPAIATALAIGLLHAFRAIGLVVGPMMLAKWINNSRLAYLFLFQGITILIWAAVVESFTLSLIASVFVGLSTTTLWSYTYTLLQSHTDEHYYGRIVSYNDMIFLLTVALVSLLVGALAEAMIPLPMITALLGCSFFMGMFYYLWIRKNYTIKEINHDL
ncbi:MAG: MFS transporter [Campylobacterota bacterium]|nr:MFS transporter [Campylobacterota bacterium]